MVERCITVFSCILPPLKIGNMQLSLRFLVFGVFSLIQ